MNQYRNIRDLQGRVKTVPYLLARSLVSRRLAEYLPETDDRLPGYHRGGYVEDPGAIAGVPAARRRGRPKGSKNKPKETTLPDPARQGEEVVYAGDLPLPSD